MFKTKNERVRTICGLVLSALLILTGVLLMVACVSVYRIGDRPFTPENIGAAFSKIAVPVFLTLFAALAAGVLSLIFPLEQRKPRAGVPPRVTLKRLTAKLDLGACEDPVRENLERSKKQRFWLLAGTVALCVALALPALIYALNFKHYEADYNASVIAACLWMLPFVACALGLCIAYLYVDKMLVGREIALVKQALAATGVTASPKEATVKENSRVVLGVRIALFVLALALIVAGIVNGGMADVLYKAINICTECIGLG